MELCSRKQLGYIFLIIIWVLWPILLAQPTQAQTTEYLPTSVEVLLACGNGYIEYPPEICDPGDPPDIPKEIGTTTCADYNDVNGDPYESGDLGCLSDCTDYASTTCWTCGNGYKETLEQCDGEDYGGKTCETFGLVSGFLICSLNCFISLQECITLPQPDSGTPGGGSSGGGAGGTSGFIPGSDKERITKVIIIGKSYPNSEVHILLDGKVIGISQADSKADFYFETTEITPGVASFGFWSEDKDGIKSTLLTLTIRIISNAVTTISGVYLSPSIDVNKKAVELGEPVIIYGQTVPETEVHIHVNSNHEIIEQTNSADDGDWSIVFDTNQVEEDFHTAKALFQLEIGGNIIKSGFSRSISFYVGREFSDEACPGADLNRDGRVNLTDFSILLYWWGTDNKCADQDQSGNVDLVDFSIMMYYWTG